MLGLNWSSLNLKGRFVEYVAEKEWGFERHEKLRPKIAQVLYHVQDEPHAHHVRVRVLRSERKTVRGEELWVV